ncbi:MAG: hypothetical protein Roseis2KO_26480 [Roseivirga sp.]
MKKLLLIVFMSIGVLSAFAQADQHWLPKKLSISVKEVPLEEVLKQLEKEMNGVVFAYSPGSFNVKKKVSIEADALPLNEILHRIFQNQDLECAEMRGKIFLKKKKKISSGKQSATPVRRRRILNTDVSKVPVAVTEKADTVVKGPSPQNEQSVAGPTAISSGGRTASSEEPQKPESKKETLPAKPSPAVMALVEEMTSPARVRSAAVSKPVVPINNDEGLSGYDQYRAQNFDRPDLPPVPVDTATVVAKPEKVKKKKEKKEKPPREPEEKKLRLYGASTTALTGIGDEAAIKMGGRAMWLKNSRFGIGLAGYAIQGGNNTDPALSNDTYKLAGGYGGLMLEYNVNPNKAIHLSFPLLIAGGAMTYALQDVDLGNIDRLLEDQRVVAIVEPGAMLEFNVIKYVKVAFDVSYRYSSHAELNYEDTGEVILAGSGLNNFSGGVTVKLGIF